MFLINKQVDYAVQLLLELSSLEKGCFLSLRTFSQNRNISFLFLQKIARTLKLAGFIAAQKGALGGYYLKVIPEEITLKDVVEALEGKYIAMACMEKSHNCPITQMCLSKNPLYQVQKDILTTMEYYTLSKMLLYNPKVI
jgi:Rrf2 family iron-sulfur cluster assembly transcriptional regulator